MHDADVRPCPRYVLNTFPIHFSNEVHSGLGIQINTFGLASTGAQRIRHARDRPVPRKPERSPTSRACWGLLSLKTTSLLLLRVSLQHMISYQLRWMPLSQFYPPDRGLYACVELYACVYVRRLRIRMRIRMRRCCCETTILRHEGCCVLDRTTQSQTRRFKPRT